jgi:2-keto-3-deoxy-6-phosphogluconate aldolase
VAVGSNLTDPKLIKEGNWAGLTEHARQFAESVRRARAK